MGKFVGGFVLLVLLGSCFGNPDAESTSDRDDSGYGDTYGGAWREDSNGNPVPEDCEAWAESSSDPFEDGDTYGQELCESWN